MFNTIYPSLMRTQVMLTMIVIAAAITGCSGSEHTLRQLTPTHHAIISTSMGDITVELYGEDAPKTVANFVGLAEKGFYNGILFHRIVPGFVIQAGDPQTKTGKNRAEWGYVGESIYGGEFEDELDTAAPSYKRGYVKGAMAMANSGPNTNLSQFFIMLEHSSSLDAQKKWTIFGKVIKGMDVAEKMGELLPGQYEDQPEIDVIIGKVTVEKL
jgi:cyclophilin family peptidyl-prolyl cis-trans isomerase